MKSKNPNLGSRFEDWLQEEGLYEDATGHAVKSILAWQVGEFMRIHGITKTAMASRMQTSRAALDRLLDPQNESVTLKTMQSAARAIGARLELNLVFDRNAA
jgi:hypothetical protein